MRSCRSLAAGAVAAAAMLVLAPAPHATATERIVIAPEAVVAGRTVRLADVASLEGERVSALGDTVLGTAPGAGESRTLDGALVLSTIARAAGNLDGITYRVPGMLRVRRATQEVGEPAVRQLIERHLASVLGPRAGDAVVRGVELPGRILIPSGPYEARVIPGGNGGLLGRTRLQVQFTVGDEVAKTAWVTADLGLFGPVVVPSRPVGRGELVTANDVVVERRDLSHEPRGVVSDPDEVVGRLARTGLAPNAAVRQEQLEMPPAVHRGDVVMLLVERGALRITAQGEVRDDAAPGEQVRVLNRATRRELVGRVLDPGTVLVQF